MQDEVEKTQGGEGPEAGSSCGSRLVGYKVVVFLTAKPSLSPSSDRDFHLSRHDTVYKALPFMLNNEQFT